MFRVGFGVLATFSILLLLPNFSANKSELEDWQSVTDGKIFVSGVKMQGELQKAIWACRGKKLTPPWEADLLEMPSNLLYNDVVQVLNRIGTADKEKFWVGVDQYDGSPSVEYGYKYGYMWRNNGSMVNVTLSDDNDRSCVGNIAYAVFSAGQIKFCSTPFRRNIYMRFICYKSAPGEKLASTSKV